MKNLLLKYIVLLGACLAPMQTEGAESALQKSPMSLFLQACAATYAHTSEVERVMKEIGLGEITGTEAQQYLQGNAGKAWRGSDTSTPYAVTVQPNGLCTVFIFAGDADQLQKDLDWWLPPKSTGIKVTIEDLTTSPELKTTSYELRGGKVRERWVITISSNPNSSLRALLSWSPL